jgi:suppressor of ftsI
MRQRPPAAAAIIALVATLSLAERVAHADAAPAREPLRDLPEIRAEGGVAKATFRVSRATVPIGNTTVRTLVYGDSYLPPSIRVARGDRIELTLVNDGDQSTNIHYHGMQVSPLEYGDNIWTRVPPSHEYTYRITIPEYHQPGLYWHHSHAHQSSERLVMSGLAGAVIVDGVLEGWPELAAANLTEHVLVLSAVQRAWNGDLTWGIQTSGIPLLRTVNGQSDPAIAIRPGETQLWRFVNQSSDHYFNLELGGKTFWIVATDGNPVPVMKPATRYLLAPAARVEVLVQGGDPGETPLTTSRIRTGPAGDGYPAERLATMVCAGEPAATRIALPIARDASKPVEDLRTRKIDATRTIVFDETDNDFRVNNSVFVGSRVDTRVPFGTVEKWTIVNATAELHAFHIHQTDFQVVSVNGEPQPFDGHLDTVNVPIYGQIEIVIPFTHPCVLGKFVYHCHILEHEDGGMMASIEVFDPNAPAAGASSALQEDHETVKAADPNATGGPFRLVDERGVATTESDFDGLTLLAFGYTKCLGACPRTMASYGRVQAILGNDDPSVRYAFVSVDTARETDATLAAYVAAAPVPLVAMRGTPEETAAAARSFGATYEPQPPDPDGSYSVRHSTDLYLVGPGGRIFRRFDLTTPPEEIVAAIRASAARVPHRVAAVGQEAPR